MFYYKLKPNKQILTALFSLIICSLTLSLFPQFGGGQGTEADPWQIERAEHLDNIRNYLGPNNRERYFLQTGNLDLGTAPWNVEQGWVPIGNQELPFTGKFDGNGYAISRLTISRAGVDHQGLFGVADGAIIYNVSLINVDITAGNVLGALAGISKNNGLIRDCYSTGTLRGSDHIGGLVGYSESHSAVRESFSKCNVTGNVFVGGLIGLNILNAIVDNCYARGRVTGQDRVGGLIGLNRMANVNGSYSTGAVQGNQNVGGFIGESATDPVVTNSYWDTETSGLAVSPGGGLGRLTRQMTYPYDEDTYVRWDFEEIWRNDEQGVINDGYPFLHWQPVGVSPNPNIASNPQPANEAVNISIDLERVSWSYIESEHFTNPVGFRVYMNNTGNFGDEDDYVWIDYEEDETNYTSADILPENLHYSTNYYWKVVPTTIFPDERRGIPEGRHSRVVGNSNNSRNTKPDENQLPQYRGDAVNVPVWQFRTRINPNPHIATNPIPQTESVELPVSLEYLGWTYTINPNYTNPIGFRIYYNTTGEFSEDDQFYWIPFNQGQSNYTNPYVLPEKLEYATTYYWKVVPTTNDPDRYRGDAENVPIWVFTTILINPNPQPAVNPQPEHQATGISLGLESLIWDYHSTEIYTDPVGFRVYLNTTGAFGANAPFIWVDYEFDRINYSCSEIIPDYLDPETTYYWRVIPTTIYPDEAIIVRGDAQNCPIWRFTTGTTNIYNTALPAVTELLGNYPNPFNPETNILFQLAEGNNIVLEIFNLQGKKVTTLVEDYLTQGEYRIRWNGKADNEDSVSSGIYFYRLRVKGKPDRTFVKRMMMIQ